MHARFLDMVSNIDLRDDGVKDLQSLDDVQETILLRLYDYLIAFNHITSDDEYVYNEMCIALSILLNRDFHTINGLDFDDEVVSKGELTYMLIEEQTQTADVCTLLEGAQITGNFLELKVTKTPDPIAMMETATEYDEFDNPVPMVPFGAGMILANVTLRHKNGRTEQLPSDMVMCVPLGYGSLPLKKVVSLQ